MPEGWNPVIKFVRCNVTPFTYGKCKAKKMKETMYLKVNKPLNFYYALVEEEIGAGVTVGIYLMVR